jgi:hypothetical protein
LTTVFKVLTFILMFVLFLFLMGGAHELVHQEIYTRGCEYANTSIRMATLNEMWNEQAFAYTEIYATKNCQEDIWLANMINEVVGYTFIVPIALIGAAVLIIFIYQE